MNILGIETSCDETAVAIVHSGTDVRSNTIASSREAFEHSGGVIPEIAARKQVECIQPVLEQTFQEAQCSWNDIDAIAVTYGPGLFGSLIVGTTTAHTLASIHSKPLVCVHHTLGHLSSTWLQASDDNTTPQFPILTLSVSGGHTELWYRTSHTTGTLLGRTRDDAAGEAFDKGASLLDLPYPGGPAISRLAEAGNPNAYPFPLPLKGDGSCDWSFSGLKTALKYLLRDIKAEQGDTLSDALRADIAASYQAALCRHLIDRLRNAILQHPELKEIHVVGGVSANAYLRTEVAKQFPEHSIRVPQKIRYCTDNAAMIAAAGYFLLQEQPNERLAMHTTQASAPLEDAMCTTD